MSGVKLIDPATGLEYRAGGAVGPGGGSQVEGNTASGATNSGNPVAIAGVVSTADPAYTDGQRGNVRLGASGAIASGSLAVSQTGGDASNNTASVFGSFTGAILRMLVRSEYFNGTSWDRARGDTVGAYVVSKGAGTLAMGQVAGSVSPAAAIQIVAARAGRSSVILSNITGTQPVYFVATALTTGVTTGFFLAGTAGASVTIPTSAAIFATSPTAAQTISFMEIY